MPLGAAVITVCRYFSMRRLVARISVTKSALSVSSRCFFADFLALVRGDAYRSLSCLTLDDDIFGDARIFLPLSDEMEGRHSSNNSLIDGHRSSLPLPLLDLVGRAGVARRALSATST